MTIRKTRKNEVDILMEIYASARKFMRENGNPDQWINGYPSREIIEKDISDGHSYAVEENGEIIGTFFFKKGVDKTYLRIYDGEWLNDDEYGVIHRIAMKYRGRSIASKIYSYCFDIVKSLRIDTHRQNIPMQNSLVKNGFRYCGIIYLESGDERIAYQKAE